MPHAHPGSPHTLYRTPCPHALGLLDRRPTYPMPIPPDVPNACRSILFVVVTARVCTGGGAPYRSAAVYTLPGRTADGAPARVHRACLAFTVADGRRGFRDRGVAFTWITFDGCQRRTPRGYRRARLRSVPAPFSGTCAHGTNAHGPLPGLLQRPHLPRAPRLLTRSAKT